MSVDIGAIRAAAEKATPGPWVWRADDNGQGYTSTHLDAVTDDWYRCEYYCWWDDPSDRHRGEKGKPGHEHHLSHSVINADGWHGSGDVVVGDHDAAYLAKLDPQTVLELCDLAERTLERQGIASTHWEDCWKAHDACAAALYRKEQS